MAAEENIKNDSKEEPDPFSLVQHTRWRTSWEDEEGLHERYLVFGDRNSSRFTYTTAEEIGSSADPRFWRKEITELEVRIQARNITKNPIRITGVVVSGDIEIERLGLAPHHPRRHGQKKGDPLHGLRASLSFRLVDENTAIVLRRKGMEFYIYGKGGVSAKEQKWKKIE